MPERITNKAQMYRLLNAGVLGHTLPAAETVLDAERLTRNGGLFAVRMKQAGGRTMFDLTADQSLAAVRAMPAGTWNLSPMLDDAKRVCYGHLLDGPGGWSLHYTTDPKPARLKYEQDGCEQRWLNGLAARMYLRGIMDQAGWDTLTGLIEAYPDHAIEFTVMRSRLDAFGPTNTIFWEVRDAVAGVYELSSGWDKP
jgi:hypothetical protein